MAEIIKYGQAGYIDWTGQDNEKINFRPVFTGDLPQERGFRVILGVKSKVKLYFLGRLGKVLMPYTKGFQGGKLAEKLQKVLSLSEFKAEASYDKHDYFDMIYYELANQGGIKQNDIDGTPIADAERKIFFEQLKQDVIANFWLGDTSKVHTAAGTYPDGTAYTIGSPDKYYNQIDGIITRLVEDSQVDNTDINKILKIDLPATLTTDTAENTMKEMFRKAPKVLKKLKDKGLLRFYCTDGILDNYEDSLTEGLLESVRTAKINGVERMLWNGIPLLPLDISEQLAADFPDSPQEFIILTTPDNLCLVLNVQSKFSETRFWFNPDENENRQRTQFEFGADYVLPELVVVAFEEE